MANGKLESYIKRELSLGFDMSKIQAMLLKYGYNERDIFTALDHVKQTATIEDKIVNFFAFIKRTIHHDIEKSMLHINAYTQLFRELTQASPLLSHLRASLFAVFFALLGFITILLNLFLYNTLTLAWKEFYMVTYSFVIVLFVSSYTIHKYSKKYMLAVTDYNNAFLLAAVLSIVLYFFRIFTIYGFYFMLAVAALVLIYVLREFYKAAFLQSLKVTLICYLFSCIAVFITYILLAIIIVIS